MDRDDDQMGGGGWMWANKSSSTRTWTMLQISIQHTCPLARPRLHSNKALLTLGIKLEKQAEARAREHTQQTKLGR